MIGIDDSSPRHPLPRLLHHNPHAMKVLHLSSSDLGGGAARGAYWLHQALQSRADTDSAMLVQSKVSDDPEVTEYRPALASRLARKTEQLVRDRLRPSRYFSPAALRLPIHHQINALQPDVVNLHWVGDGFLSPESLTGIRAPLVWTLRDQWPMTGGCHYAQDCGRFEAECGNCPALNSRHPDDYSRRLHRRKSRAWDGHPMTLVALSHWLADQARRSSLLGGRRTVVIPNALDTTVFQPSDQGTAHLRARLGLPADRRLILFGAMDPLNDRRKGFGELRRSAELLAQRPDATSLELVVFGPLHGQTPPTMPLRTHFLGPVDDDRALASLYAGADLTVMPSLEEAFGKVAMESMACGTPVVCFDGSGPADIVDHRVNGYLARLGDAADLAAGIAFLLDHPQPRALMGAALDKVAAHYTYERQAQMYSDLYARVLEEAKWLELRPRASS
ncbi:glycosyltransferase family 4 protein [Deinococcus radiopugnans]|nr:glycosyltransferase family 4 protein [Deinococcus radiopugnans]MBB6018230.1 glycosyltransferase involved in cell wall biosynthesis [Deinococcus radiopugnans ATCC 19172]